jgi:hypothetical protein
MNESERHEGMLETLWALIDRKLTFSRDGQDRTEEATDEQTSRVAQSWKRQYR